MVALGLTPNAGLAVLAFASGMAAFAGNFRSILVLFAIGATVFFGGYAATERMGAFFLVRHDFSSSGRCGLSLTTMQGGALLKAWATLAKPLRRFRPIPGIM